MADIIHLLPDSIANQIAAGEVIQRPASAVKELLENAVDAGATEIRLMVKEAGKTLIQVVDNGSGMSVTDARMCFERHATSKIRTAEDIFKIKTKGFRGEAMASIAAIAQVDLKTRLQEEETGTRIVIEGSDIISQEQVQCAGGSNISVKNLFYNVPARRTFLKSNTVELKHIIDEFERVVLAHPGIFFSLQNNGIELFHLKPGNYRQRVIHLFGSNYNEKLVPIEENTSVANIRGFIGKPDSAKKTKGEQFFFVNNRYIRSPYLHHAVMSVYNDLIVEGNYPLYTIYIDIDPSRIDVNVHPTKQEIKFEDERIIYTFIQAGVRHALAQYSVTPTLDFSLDPTFANLPSFYKKQPQDTVSKNLSFKTYESRMNENPAFEKSNFPDFQPKEFDRELTAVENKEQEKTGGNEERIFGYNAETTPSFQIHYQYIVAQIKSGFIVIDQQAAHERVLFEKYLSQLHNKKHHTQQQLFPQSLTLSGADAAILLALLNDINNLGFDIQPFGKETFVIHGVPVEFENGNEQKVIEDLIEQFKEDKAGLKLHKHEGIAKSLARSNSIKRGQKLDERGMRHLTDQLFACATPFVSPFGTLTFTTFSLDELAKQFQKNN